MKINVVGSIFGSTGYDSHCRQLVNALYKLNPDIKLDVPMPPNYLELVNDAELKMITKGYRVPDATIAVMTPPFWRISLADNTKKFIGFCVWEGDRIPKYWVEYLLDERVDQIWVPSQHTKDAILETLKYNTFFKGDIHKWNKIKIVPHGVDLEKFYKKKFEVGGDAEGNEKLVNAADNDDILIHTEAKGSSFVNIGNKPTQNDITKGCITCALKSQDWRDNKDDVFVNVFKKEDIEKEEGAPIGTFKVNKSSKNKIKKESIKDIPFRFICNKGWRGGFEDRGGVAYVLKAFKEEFKKGESVELILKLNQAYISPLVVNQKLEELDLPKDTPPIHVVVDNMPYEELYHLYNDADVYVCAQRADAFNIPGLEAMACGLPTIQTNFGGQTDYVNDKNGVLIGYKLEGVKDDIQYEEVQWAIPDVKELRKVMRDAFENREDIKKKGTQALQDVKEWTWDKTAKKAMTFLNEKPSTTSE